MELLSKVSSAQDNSERRQLAREVVNLFFHAGQDTTQNQRDAFGDVLCRLLSDMAQSMRIELANKVSAQNGAPKKLVKALAVSEAEVAQPVLTRSPQLKVDDLIEVANTATTQHRLAISKREHLPECVTDSLIQFEENIVMQSVAANETARISDNGFSTLARNSGSDEQIMHALINREDLPPQTVRHKHGWRLQPAQQAQHPAVELRIALAVRGGTKEIQMGLHPSVDLGELCRDLRAGPPLKTPGLHLGQIRLRHKTVAAKGDPCGLLRPAQWRNQAGRRVLCEDRRHQHRLLMRLCNTEIRQIRFQLPLNPAFGIPDGLPMAQKPDLWKVTHRHILVNS